MDFHAELYDSTTAKRLAELLRGAAVSVSDQFAASADEYERSYAARLDDLIGMLDGQVR